MVADMNGYEPPTFVMLGPLAVRDGDAVEPLKRTKQTTFLARLLLAPNEYVSAVDIKEAAWGDAPAPDTLLHVYASRLRVELEPHGAGIKNSDQSYRLIVDPMRIDLHRFRWLVREAGKAAGPARRAIDAALALCRGPELLNGFDGDWLTSYRTAHADQWRDVLLRRNRLWFDEGLHEELMIELRPIVARRPDDERLAEDYLLAMYRSGRLGEALSHYLALNKLISREHGRPPSKQLQDLNSRMIRQDEVLDYGAVPSAPAAPPANLAPGPVALVGRDAELGALRSRLTVTASRTVAVVIVTGAPTIGKTSLAVAFANNVKDIYPGGTLQANFGGSRPAGGVAVDQILTEFLIALGVTPARIPAEPSLKLALYRYEIRDRKMLILLDDVVSEHDAAMLMPQAPGSLVIITTRRRLPTLVTSHQSPPLVLGPLPDASAAVLLAHFTGAGRAGAEPEARDAIVAACGGMPLAVCLAGAYLAQRPDASLDGVASMLANPANRLSVLDLDAEDGDSLAALFQWSYGRLPEDQARMFRLLGISPCVSHDAPAAAALADVPASTAATLLSGLADAHLVTPVGDDRYTMLDLIASYAANLAAAVHTGTAQTDALERLTHHLTSSARAATNRLWLTGESHLAAIFDQDKDAAAWLEEQRTALLNVARQAGEQGRDADIIELSRVLARYLDHGGFVAEAIELHRAAAQASVSLGDRNGRAFALTQLAGALIRRAHFDPAITALQEALTIYTDLGDLRGMGAAYGNLGRVESGRGALAAAKTLQERSVECLRSAGYRLGLARGLTNLGNVLVGLGDLDEALVRYEEARAICATLSAPDALARAYASIARVHQMAGRLPEATELYEQALAAFETVLDHNGIAITLTNLGALATERRRFHDAVGLHERAIAMFEAMSDRANTVEVLNSLGVALLGCGRAGEALTRHTDALAAAVAGGQRREAARAHSGMAECLDAIGTDPSQVQQHVSAAVAIYAELGLAVPERLRAFIERTQPPEAELEQP